jgi:hypothetical protein
MAFQKEKLVKEFVGNPEKIKKALEKNSGSFQPYWEDSYKLIMEYPDNDKYSNKSISVLYCVLKEWMQKGASRLNKYKDFKKSVLDNADLIKNLRNTNICDIGDSDKEEEIKSKLKELFDKLKITTANAKIVSFSKTMHFLLPQLVPPMDWENTLKFFGILYGDEYNEWEVFWEILKEYSDFARKEKLDIYRDGDWNKYLPKLIDNIVCGAV